MCGSMPAAGGGGASLPAVIANLQKMGVNTAAIESPRPPMTPPAPGAAAPTHDPMGNPIDPAKIGQATLAGGPPGSLQAVLESLMRTIQSLVAALGGSPAAAPSAMPTANAPSAIEAQTARGTKVTVVKDPTTGVFALALPTGADEGVVVDGKQFYFDAQGRDVTREHTARLQGRG